MQNKEKKKENHNLAILGVTAVLIAILTSSISLFIYHQSGDIYLDCSLPDADCPSAHAKTEDQEKVDSYVFKDSGTLDQKAISEYLEKLQKSVDEIDQLKNPYASDSLSDKALGL
jgi:hypothetical protein